MNKIRLNINGKEVSGFKGQTILDLALENCIDIPTFCYDERLNIYGSCGICVVEVEGFPKLLRACATEISDGMILKTDSPKVIRSRKMNLELLLSQHKGDCVAPCALGCPAQTDCQGYVGLIANGDYYEAIKLIKSKIPLPASIGRVCPHPCESDCRRKLVEEPISILNLKRFAADIDLMWSNPYLPEIAPSTGKVIAIAGGGPGGLSCAYFLAEKGHAVTVFDMMPKSGGMLRYGIPEYRLPKAVLDKEIALIEEMGVVINNNIKIGRDITFDYLKKTYDAVVIAIGAWQSTELPCPGAQLDGVYGGIDFLQKAVSNEPLSIGDTVAVIGGGNTAMDACRTAIRLGAKQVYNVYRRTRAEMPAEEIEIVEAGEEGVIFKYLTNPVEVLGENGKVTEMRLQKMELGEPDASGRRRPVPVEGQDEMLKVDSVICALGQGISPEGFDEIELSRWKTVVADENVFTTNKKGVFAIGDCINDGATIAIEAVADAKKAAEAINYYLNGAELKFTAPYRVVRDDLGEADFENRKKEPRSAPRHDDAEIRRDNFLEYTDAFTTDAAINEAARCLECGCHDFFECKLIKTADQYDVKPDRFRESVPDIEFSDEHPFIKRDPNKCILCGLCVRICDEIVGAGALGFVARGYDTVVRPAFDDALTDTSCISCGQCVSVCPTGALGERGGFVKPVPLDTKKTPGTCGMCALGCSVIIESAGDIICKITAAKDKGINEGLMCGLGRFAPGYLQSEHRITSPMIKSDGKLKPVSWNEAFVYTANKMKSFKMRGEKTAVAIGQSYCIEDIGAVKNLAKIFESEIFSHANRTNGLVSVLGVNCSPNTLDEVAATDRIIIFGVLLLTKPAVIIKLRHAIARGAEVTVVTAGDEEINLSCGIIRTENSTDFLKQITKAIIIGDNTPKNTAGFDELKTSLEKVTPSDDAARLAKSYKAAKKAMILFSHEELSTAAAAEIANIAVVAGHIGSPRDGIYMLRQMAGSQILADMDITKKYDDINESKALMIFGEDVDIGSKDCETGSKKFEFLMVQDTHMTKAAEKADVVFPLAIFPEIDGMYVNTERRLSWNECAVSPPFMYRTSQIAAKIAEQIEKEAKAVLPCELYPNAKLNEPYKESGLRTDTLSFGNIQAKLQVLDSALMFEPAMNTSHLANLARADLRKR